MTYLSRKLSETEENYTENERELLGLVYFIKLFRCYLERNSFKIITDYYVLKNSFTKLHMSRKDDRWLEFLTQFGI